MDEFAARRVDHLTDAQRRILRLRAGGATATEIVLRLELTPRDVRAELLGLLQTLGVRTLTEAALVWWGSRAGARADLAVIARQLVA